MRRICALLLAALLAMGLSACRSTPAGDAGGAGGRDIYLTLVNPTHKLPDRWLDMIELVPARNSLGEEYLVERETLAHFEGLRAEVLEEEGVDIELDSAYRSVEEQQEIWDEFSERYGDDVGKIVSEPGYSEHHTGLAVDVFIIDGDAAIRDNDDLFAAEELFAKVHRHLADHGFILSVLPGKEEVCGGLAYEPWHFMYVGEGRRTRWPRGASSWRSISASWGSRETRGAWVTQPHLPALGVTRGEDALRRP